MGCEATSVAKQCYRYRQKCSHARCKFVARGSTWLSCSTGMCRHIRENHGPAAHATRTRRQAQQLHRRKECYRAARGLLVQGLSEQHLFVVTCPLHRESMWIRTREKLVAMGVSVKRIVRRRGIHFEHYQQNGYRLCHDLPAGLKRCTFLMWDFHHRFLNSCSKWFEKDIDLQYIWWVEDDCSFKTGVDMESLHAIAVGGKALIHWAGYKRKRGEPTWGSHLAVIHRSSVAHLIAQRDKEANEAGDLSYLMGLDTWFRNGQMISVAGKRLVVASSESVGYQRRHEWAWRR